MVHCYVQGYDRHLKICKTIYLYSNKNKIINNSNRNLLLMYSNMFFFNVTAPFECCIAAEFSFSEK